MKFSKHGFLPILFIALVALVSISSCKKEQFLENGGSIRYSVDTFMFDTVFTAQGSSTRILKIYNDENRPVKISSIKLAKGAQSRFYFNINGTSGYNINNVELAAKDSMYVFLGVNIDPTNADDPFVVSDELISTLNGNDYDLPLYAYGQNAIYIVDSVLQTQTWTNDKPYVIMQNALVDEGATLTIEAGTKIYVHADSRLYVIGSLLINGSFEQPVLFQGDRLDRMTFVGEHIGIPGEWGGLYFFPQSHSNMINYAVFANGGASTKFGENSTVAATIQLDPDTTVRTVPKLTITNSKIYNSQGYGLLAFNSSFVAENCLFVECGSENIACVQGGNYKIYDCTIASYGWRFLTHSDAPSMSLTNFLNIDQNNYTSAPLTVDMQNTIVTGSLKNEIFVAKVNDHPANVTILNSLMKYDDSIESFVTINNSVKNEDPLFVEQPSNSKMNYLDWDYHVKENSPAIGAGIYIGTLTKDLDDKTRNVPPTIGCYEYQP